MGEVEPADVDDADQHAGAVAMVARGAEAALLCRGRPRARRHHLRGRTGQGLAELDAERPGLVAQLECPLRRDLDRAEVALGLLVVALDAERLLRIVSAGRVLGDPDEDAHRHLRRHVAQALGTATVLSLSVVDAWVRLGANALAVFGLTLIAAACSARGRTPPGSRWPSSGASARPWIRASSSASDPPWRR